MAERPYATNASSSMSRNPPLRTRCGAVYEETHNRSCGNLSAVCNRRATSKATSAPMLWPNR
ncbi:Uncharacterised protein [Mycobacteroides abscessus subsp. abscessus]|nr:Uncharacterised protein [Mycobacteroides abscessus subsp. abscessus]